MVDNGKPTNQFSHTFDSIGGKVYGPIVDASTFTLNMVICIEWYLGNYGLLMGLEISEQILKM